MSWLQVVAIVVIIFLIGFLVVCTVWIDKMYEEMRGGRGGNQSDDDK